MSLESTLARIAQIETALAPPATSAAALTGGTAAPASLASGSSFASTLAQAMTPAANEPTSAAATAATYNALTAADPTAATTLQAATTTTLPAATTTTLPAATTTTLPAATTTTLPATTTTLPATTTTLPAATTTTLPSVSAVAGQPAASGDGNQAMVAIAQSQIGQAEEPLGSNESPAIETYKTATAGSVPGDGAPWCAYFASWVAREAGTPVGDQGQGSGAVSQIWSWAQQTGRAIPNGPGVVPQPGDLICFGDEHVGIVESVLPNGNIETIEGNYNNRVSQNVRSPTEATGYVDMS